MGHDMVWYTPETPPFTDAHGSAQYEFRVISLPPTASRSQVRQLLTEQAEYGRWELARTLLYLGGSRKVWLRRKIIKVRSTL